MYIKINTLKGQVKVKHNIILRGFYQAEDVKSETLVNSIKDTLSRIDILLSNCKLIVMMRHPTWLMVKLE